jgi:hypothetical protein
MATHRKVTRGTIIHPSNGGDGLDAANPKDGDEFDWAAVFAPRQDLESAMIFPLLKRGSRGRRQLGA